MVPRRFAEPPDIAPILQQHSRPDLHGKIEAPDECVKKDRPTERNSRATVSGPAKPDGPPAVADALAEKFAGTQELAAEMPFNSIKPAEYDPASAIAPPAGPSFKASDPLVGSSTVTERHASDKVGSGSPSPGANHTIGPLDRVRADASQRTLTTNQGVPLVTTRAHSRRACADRRCSKTSSSARRSPTSTTSASLNGSCTLAGRRRTVSSSVTNRSRNTPEHPFFQRPGSRRLCSFDFRPCSASADRPTRPATCAASP